MVSEKTLRSRSWKVFPNEFVQTRFSTGRYNGLDGELILGDPRAKDVYRVTNAALQRESGDPDVQFYVFDDFSDRSLIFEKRRDSLIDYIGEAHIKVVDQKVINNEQELLTEEERCLLDGFEGLMLRSPTGLYKYGRSTVNTAELLKLKRFEDSEAEILDYYEEMHNANKAKKNAFGRTERSSHQENLVGKGTLGGIVVRDLSTGVEFSIGTGFDSVDRAALWANRGKLKGQIIKYKFFPVGVKDKPRHPVYIGPRHKWDL